jgi:GT2 family glycosyltransferase
MWAGSLFNLRAVEVVGLPPKDYFLEFGDFEYGYRGKEAGYRTFLSRLSIINHHLHFSPVLQAVRSGKRAPALYAFSSPFRCYYFFRNFLYFLTYEYREQSSAAVRAYYSLRYLLGELVKIWMYSEKPLPQLLAGVRGIWDGLWKNMHHRY